MGCKYKLLAILKMSRLMCSISIIFFFQTQYMGQQFLGISHMGIKAGHQPAPALFCLQGLCISIHAFKCWFLFGWANTKQPPTHQALVILQPFQAHRPVQPHKMGGLQLPAAYQNRTVMFLDDRSEKTSTQRRKY